MRRADKENRKFVILVGEDEVKAGKLLLKNMETGEQELLSVDEIAGKVKE